MPYPTLHNDDIRDSRQINFISREEPNFPQLMRFCMDFDFCVLELQRKSFSHISKRYLAVEPAFVLVNSNYRDNCITYSPHCNTLLELEAYSCTHYVDILHTHLFGNVSTENNTEAAYN